MEYLVARHVEVTGRQPTIGELANIHIFAQRSTRDAKEHRAEPVTERLDRAQASPARPYTLDGPGQLIRAHRAGPVSAGVVLSSASVRRSRRARSGR
jgi:hypothetical protein